MRDHQSSNGASPVGGVEKSPGVNPSGSPTPEGASPTTPPSAVKSAAVWCLATTRKAGASAWKFVGDIARYYWGIREALWEYLAGFAPDLMSESVRMREVRFAPYEAHTLAEFSSTGWTATVPGRCVVCGEPTQNPPGDDDLAIDDASRAFWVPVGTWLAGAVLGLFLWNRWYLLLTLPLGTMLGFLLRNKVSVRLRLARCDEHAGRTNIPQVLAWGNTLVLRFGHKLVRKVFLYGEPMATTVPQPDAYASSVPGASGHSPPPFVAETIPLADSPSAEDSTIRHDRPPIFDETGETPSPLIP
jgi:hypothetical protein